MRGPIAVGVLSALLVVLVAGAAFVALALARPGPAVPSLPPIAAAPTADVPATAPAATATSGPTGSPSPAAESPSGPPATGGPSPEPSPSSPPSASPRVGLAVGDLAPRLTVPQLGGAEMDTAALAGKPIWVDFMATWCPPCVDELPVMERLQRQLGTRMTIIVVDVGEDEDTVASFMTALAIDLPVGLDTDGAAQRAWGAYALPVHYWIGPDGRVGGFLDGGASPRQFVDGVHTVLPEASLEP